MAISPTELKWMDNSSILKIIIKEVGDNAKSKEFFADRIKHEASDIIWFFIWTLCKTGKLA